MLRTPSQPRSLAFLAVALPGAALAAPFEAQLLQGTDAAGRSMFVPNPAAYLPAKSGFAYAEAVQDHVVRATNNSDQAPVTTETAFNELTRSVGFTLASGGKFALGVQGNFRKEESRSKMTGTNFDTTALEEYRWHREGVGKVALEFTKELKAGLMFRYQHRKADVMGSFNGGNADRTEFSGSLYGLGVGGMFQAATAGVGAAYVTPLRGKVEVTGEKKVTTDPGFIHGSAYFDLSPQFRLGAVYEQWLHEKDELARTTTSPNPMRQLQVDLRGVNPERTLFLKSRIMVGADYSVTKNSGVRVSVARDTYEWVFNADNLPGEDGNDANVFNGYHARAAVMLGTEQVGLQFGANYGLRKHAPKPNANANITYKATELDFFGMVNFAI